LFLIFNAISEVLRMTLLGL